MGYVRLGDILIKAGVITEDQLSEALAVHNTEGHGRLGDTLQELGYITERQLADALVMQLGIDFVDLNMQSISPDLVQLMPKGMVKRYMAVPVKVSGNQVWMAMSDPLDFVAQEAMQSTLKKKVIPMVATKSAMERAVQSLYSDQGAIQAIDDMKKDISGRVTSTVLQSQYMTVDIGDDSDDVAPAIRLVNSIIDRACSDGASDVHLEPEDDGMSVRMRIDGTLRTMLEVPKELRDSVISRFKVMAKMDIAQKMIPQDGRSVVSVRGETIDLRMSTLPTVNGESVVIRLLRKEGGLSTFEGIGLTGENAEAVERVISKNREGVVLVVGPTGAGKTSTLYAMINRIKSSEINLVSIEDPVEYHMSGVRQVQVNEKQGMTFAGALRSVLRQDPDVIAIGEIRDSETAEIALRAAMTGHFVLSTVHTNNAVSSIDRLLDIGVEPYLIAGGVKGIVSQRLVRRTCQYCSRPYKPESAELEMMGLTPGEYTFRKGKGCSECFGSGYRGRTAVFEILEFNNGIQRAIRSGSRQELESAIASTGFHSIREDCERLVLDGTICSSEAFRVFGGI